MVLRYAKVNTTKQRQIESEDLIMVEKFIKDYAKVKKNEIMIDVKIKEELKDKAIAKINKAVFLRQRAYLTRDEAISMILNCFEK